MKKMWLFEVVASSFADWGVSLGNETLVLTLDEVSNHLGKGYTLRALPDEGSPYRPGEMLFSWDR